MMVAAKKRSQFDPKKFLSTIDSGRRIAATPAQAQTAGRTSVAIRQTIQSSMRRTSEQSEFWMN